MLIVDSQVHIWAADSPERPWPAEGHEPQKPEPFSKDDLLKEMNAAGVDRAIIVPPRWEGIRNDLALEAARLHPERFAIMGVLDPDDFISRNVIATWREQRGMLGLRFAFRRRQYQALLSEGRVDWIWAEAEKNGLPIMIMVSHAQMHLVDQIAERHPALKLVMDHLALTRGNNDEETFAGLDRLLAMAKHSNIAVKASGLPYYTTDRYPYLRLHPYLRRVYDNFGPKRVFWGSDFLKLPCSYRQAVTMFTEEVSWLTNEDKEWLMGRGVCEWLGWALPQRK